MNKGKGFDEVTHEAILSLELAARVCVCPLPIYYVHIQKHLPTYNI